MSSRKQDLIAERHKVDTECRRVGKQMDTDRDHVTLHNYWSQLSRTLNDLDNQIERLNRDERHQWDDFASYNYTSPNHE